MRKSLLLGIISILTLSCTAVDGVQYPVEIGDSVFFLEVADSPQERQQGLMYRRDLPANDGMIFIFEDEESRSFWMRNTYVDLSIAYLSSEGTIIDILPMYALDETSVPSSAPAQYAIELNQGAFENTGAAVGDVIDLSPLPGH